jgi:hypothetical protein
MKLTPSSTARRKTFLAFSRSGGQPHIPSPVSRIAPNPSRLTNRSPPSRNVSALLLAPAARSFDNPPVRTPAALAESAIKNVRRVRSLCIGFPFLLHNSSFCLRRILPLKRQLHLRKSLSKTSFVSLEVKYVAAISSQLLPVRRRFSESQRSLRALSKLLRHRSPPYVLPNV